MSRKAEDHEIFDSQQTIARAFGCDPQSIVRSQKRLQELGWLSRPQRRGRTNALSLNYENIPSEKAVQILVTQDARTLSLNYMTELENKGLKRKTSKHWFARQHFSAQKILNRCGENLELATKIVKFAIGHPRLVGKAKKSLYELNGAWSRVRSAYDTAHPETAEPTQQTAQPILTVETPQPQAKAPVQLMPQVSKPMPQTPAPQSLPAYSIRRSAHPGVGLRWDSRTNEVADLKTGAVIGDGEVHRRIISTGLRRDLLSGQFVRSDTYESLPPDEVNLRLMGSDAWQREMQQSQAHVQQQEMAAA